MNHEFDDGTDSFPFVQHQKSNYFESWRQLYMSFLDSQSKRFNVSIKRETSSVLSSKTLT